MICDYQTNKVYLAEGIKGYPKVAENLLNALYKEGIETEYLPHSKSKKHVWARIEPLIEGLPLVAHNSPFDEGCLKSVFRVYQMDYPDYEFHDTLRASRRHFGRDLPNH